MIHDFVNAVKGVLFVDDGVEQDTECPDILFFTPIGFTGKNLGSSIV
jgi:hypothetical protein